MLRERFLNAVNFEENYLIGFIIITHNYLITAKLRVCNWDSVSNNNNIIMEYMVYATQFYMIAYAQRTHHCLCVCIHMILIYQDGLVVALA